MDLGCLCQRHRRLRNQIKLFYFYQVYFALQFVFSALLQLFLPWWSGLVLVVCISAGWNKDLRESFVLSGFSQSLLWLIMMLYQDYNNEQILSSKISVLLGLPSPLLLIPAITLASFVVHGLGGLAGALIRETFFPNRTHDVF